MGATSRSRKKPLEDIQQRNRDLSPTITRSFVTITRAWHRTPKLIWEQQPGQYFDFSLERHWVKTLVTAWPELCPTKLWANKWVVLSHYIFSDLLHSIRKLIQGSCNAFMQHYEHKVYHADNDGNGNSAELELTFLNKTLIASLKKRKILSLQIFILLIM